MVPGQFGTGNWSHCRHCAVHGWHGSLYTCLAYPEAVRQEIEAADQRYRANLADPAWQQRQLNNGVPPVVLVVFRALAGVE